MSRWAQAAASAESGKSRWMDDERANDSEFLDYETKRVQGDSLQSSRRALARLNETEIMAQNSMSKLNQQSEQLYNIEKKLDQASVYAEAGNTKVDSLKTLNKFFMLPSFGAAKKAKAADDKMRRELTLEKAQGKAGREREDDWKKRGDRIKGYSRQSSASSREFKTTPHGFERDEYEDEIDNNLGQISSGLSRLKAMGQQMGDELDSQSNQIRRIGSRSDSSREKVDRMNSKMKGLLKK